MIILNGMRVDYQLFKQRNNENKEKLTKDRISHIDGIIKGINYLDDKLVLRDNIPNSPYLGIRQFISTICLGAGFAVDNPSILANWRGWNYNEENLMSNIYDKNKFTVIDFEKVCRTFALVYQEIYKSLKKLNLPIENTVIPCYCGIYNFDVNFNLDSSKWNSTKESSDWTNYIQQLFNTKFKDFTAKTPSYYYFRIYLKLKGHSVPLTVYININDNNMSGMLWSYTNESFLINETELKNVCSTKQQYIYFSKIASTKLFNLTETNEFISNYTYL